MDNIDDLFINPREKRQRAGLRVLNTVAIVSLFLMAGQFMGDIVSDGLDSGSTNHLILKKIISAIFILGGIYFARKKFDKRSMLSLGLNWEKNSLKLITHGAAIGVGVILIFTAFALVAGLIEFQGFNQEYTVWSNPLYVVYFVLTFGLLKAFIEEVFLRGLLYQNLEEGINKATAIIISLCIYSLPALLSNNPTWHGILISISMGSLLLFCFLSTRSLWLSFGLNLGWSTSVIFFGLKTTGSAPQGLFNFEMGVPHWLSGGKSGAEASFLIMPIFLLAFAVVLSQYGKQK